MKQCIYCGAELEDSARACNNCGRPVPDMPEQEPQKHTEETAAQAINTKPDAQQAQDQQTAPETQQNSWSPSDRQSAGQNANPWGQPGQQSADQGQWDQVGQQNAGQTPWGQSGQQNPTQSPWDRPKQKPWERFGQRNPGQGLWGQAGQQNTDQNPWTQPDQQNAGQTPWGQSEQQNPGQYPWGQPNPQDPGNAQMPQPDMWNRQNGTGPMPQGYGGYPGYGNMQNMQGRYNTFAIGALVFGVMAMFLNSLMLIPSIIAIVFAVLALLQISRNPGMFRGKGLAVAGLILGIIFLVVYIYAFRIALQAIQNPETLEQLQKYLREINAGTS